MAKANRSGSRTDINLVPTPLQIVKPLVERETVEELRKLLKQAEEGAIVGLVFVALHPAGAYHGDAVGRAKQFPLYCLGLIKALEGVLTKLIA